MLAYHVILADDRVIVRHELNRIIAGKRNMKNIVDVWTPTKFREFVETVRPHVKIVGSRAGLLATPMPGLMPLEEFKTLILCKDDSGHDCPSALESVHERYFREEHGDKEILKAIERVCYGGVYIFYLSPAFFNRLSLLTNQSHAAWQPPDQSSRMSSEETSASTTPSYFS